MFNYPRNINIYIINNHRIVEDKMVFSQTKQTVYHGTNLFSARLIRKYGILLHAQRELTDFGIGFYVTPNRKQAIEWAYVKAKNPQVHPMMLNLVGLNKHEFLQHPDTKTPAFLTFTVDWSCLFSLNGLIFPMRSEEHTSELQSRENL